MVVSITLQMLELCAYLIEIIHGLAALAFELANASILLDRRSCAAVETIEILREKLRHFVIVKLSL